MDGAATLPTASQVQQYVAQQPHADWFDEVVEFLSQHQRELDQFALFLEPLNRYVYGLDPKLCSFRGW